MHQQKDRESRKIEKRITAHYGQGSKEWDLWNINYHQMVSVLMQVVQNFTTLQVDAPEWYLQRSQGSKSILNDELNKK